jgi:predicted small integral membrane protein
MALLAEMAAIDHAEDFYWLAWDKKTRKLIGYILEIPNFMQVWAGEPITMGNTNSVIISKAYRGAAFFHFLYNKLTAKLNARGVIHREGTMIWTKNVPAITSFSKIGFQCRKFRVYQKTILF